MVKYPFAVSAARGREDLEGDTLIVLWRCCQLYDRARGAGLGTLAYRAIFSHMTRVLRFTTMRIEKKKYVQRPVPLSFSETLFDAGANTLAELLPAQESGYGGTRIAMVIRQETA